ncbi:hypothetical protein [Luteimonas rhizosphaerae]|uniref:hypothetical protein n=1 Tax=Luteimonas sp. 4-12 TaxID=2027406 RepID=UPI0013043258|nr:hypothetical protein [Luteimonas sp. 4-12]
MDIRFSALRHFDIRTGIGAPVAVFFTARTDVVVGGGRGNRTEQVRPLQRRLHLAEFGDARIVAAPLVDRRLADAEEPGNRGIGCRPARLVGEP